MADVRREFKPGRALEVQRVLAQRMTLIMDRYELMPVEEREQTLVHEMVHTALGPDTSGRVPQWLVEGLALYVSREDPRARGGRGGGGAPLAAAAQQAGRDRQAQRRRQERRLRDRLRRSARDRRPQANEGLFRFFEAFNDSTITGPPGPRTTDKVMRKSIGLSLAELDAAIG